MGGNPFAQKQANFTRALRPLRVKILALPDQAQAVVYLDGENLLQITVYGYASDNKPVILEAPFKFESAQSRDLVFNDMAKINNFACAVFVAQMVKIDPKLNTDNFKQLTP